MNKAFCVCVGGGGGWGVGGCCVCLFVFSNWLWFFLRVMYLIATRDFILNIFLHWVLEAELLCSPSALEVLETQQIKDLERMSARAGSSDICQSLSEKKQNIYWDTVHVKVIIYREDLSSQIHLEKQYCVKIKEVYVIKNIWNWLTVMDW